eukprot:scaffold53559_cov66-Phaeocystis_antarctica.AAC.12
MRKPSHHPSRTLLRCLLASGPHLTPHRFDSAGREEVQPGAELRHFQRHGHELYVFGALCLYPGPMFHPSSLKPSHHTGPAPLASLRICPLDSAGHK